MRTIIVTIFLICFIVFNTYSQDKIEKQKPEKSFLREDRVWTFEIPIWIPGFRGEFAYGDVSLEGEDGQNPGIPEHPIESPPSGKPPWGEGNIITRLFTSSSYLKFFFMSRIAFEKNNLLIQADGFSGSVGSNLNYRFNEKTVVKADLSMYLFRVFGGYKLINKTINPEKLRYELYVYAGARIHFINLESDPGRIIEPLDISPMWTEPLIGIQNQLTMKNWMFIFTIDYGGYLMKEKGSFMINLLSYYKLSNFVSLKAGWTDWDIKHKEDYKGENLKIDVHLSGPSIGVGFHF